MAEYLLPVDYKADWEYMDGIETVKFEFGPQRESLVGSLVAPDESKMRRTSPNQEALTYGTGLAWEPKGQTVVLFVDTLRSGGSTGVRIVPHSGDKILAFDGYWIIQSVKLVADQSQWKMLLEQSTKTPKDYLDDVDGLGVGSMAVGSSLLVR